MLFGEIGGIQAQELIVVNLEARSRFALLVFILRRIQRGEWPQVELRLPVWLILDADEPFLGDVTVDGWHCCAEVARGLTGALDTGARCSQSVLMQVETLGEALAAGWRVHARCLGGRSNTRAPPPSAAIRAS